LYKQSRKEFVAAAVVDTRQNYSKLLENKSSSRNHVTNANGSIRSLEQQLKLLLTNAMFQECTQQHKNKIEK
jgi:hypothetical protein